MKDGDEKEYGYRERAERERVERLERFVDALFSVGYNDGSEYEVLEESAAVSTVGHSMSYERGMDYSPENFCDFDESVDHSEHRKRLRERLSGIDDWSEVDDAELLEGLLAFTVPRVDVKPLAESILGRYGNSLWSVLNADPKELAEFRNMTERTSRVTAHVARLAHDGGRKSASISSRADALEFFSSLNVGDDGVKTHVAYLDADYGVIEVETIRGESAVDPAIIVGAAYKLAASSVVIGRRDSALLPQWFGGAEYAEELRELLDTIGVKLLDILVFSGLGYYSLGMTAVKNDMQAVYSFVPLVAVSDVGPIVQSLMKDDGDG